MQSTGVGSGTSIAAPAFAGIQALVNQKTNSRQGLANYVYYQLAKQQQASNCNSTKNGGPDPSCVFYDITMGSNAVPCQSGSQDCVQVGSNYQLLHFDANPGYDLATGLGSVNVSNLVDHWNIAFGGVPKPDLVETAVGNPPPTVNLNESFQATDMVLNQGAAAAVSVTRYYLSLDTARNAGDKLLTGTRSVPALAAGSSSTGTVTVTVPAKIKPGPYYLLACADDGKVVKEANEKNNCVASTGTVTASAQGGGTIGLGQTVSGTLSASAPAGHCNGGAPADRWQFTLTATTTVTIEADSVPFDTYLCLVDSSNVGRWSDTDSGPGTNARIVAQNVAPGTYYIEVSSQSAGNAGGAYKLSLQAGLPLVHPD